MTKVMLAQNIFSQIQADIAKFGVQHAKSVTLRVDRTTKVKLEALQKEIEDISMNTLFKNTTWTIREMKIRERCKCCHSIFEFTSQDLKSHCPFCRSKRVEKIDRGRFVIVGFEI